MDEVYAALASTVHRCCAFLFALAELYL